MIYKALWEVSRKFNWEKPSFSTLNQSNSMKTFFKKSLDKERDFMKNKINDDFEGIKVKYERN